METYDPTYEPGKCKCGSPGREDHTCPFAEDVHGDSITQCNCCKQCTHNCADDI